ncbi:phosphotransferase [Candidatus Woesearchaeota archaeon]|nr:phosphotransferase [Candidatus Woesearchaeota archaeon]
MKKTSSLIIGVDFDNTIVDYDELFYALALEKKLIPADIGRTKSDVRNYLRSVNNEDAWTELQGIGYTTKILGAKPFVGALEFFKKCKEAGITVLVISHKTKHPFIGEKEDLHSWARKWLDKHGFYSKTGLSDKEVFFELTKEEKMKRIRTQGCDYFIDDLPEFLEEKEFPSDVKKILFDPNNKYADSSSYERYIEWDEILENIISANEIENNAKGLLAKIGMKGKFSIERLTGGRNNKVYKITTDGKEFLLKQYFSHKNDPRNRLKAEYSFTTFCWNNNIKSVPKPFACDEKNQLGLYEFVNGRKLKQEEVNKEHINQAIDLFIAVNKYKNKAEAKKLPIASEACFSTKEHIALVEKRIERLKNIQADSDINKQAKLFIEKELIPKWEEVLKRIKKNIKDKKIDDKKISNDEKCISPSDFGYHNALLEEGKNKAKGKLRFLDFEYSGWDDPAKTLCDYFCQPELAAPIKYYDYFAKKAFANNKYAKKIIARASSLLPAYRIKWCCIMLNEFTKTDSERRKFASPEDLNDMKRKQLEKTREYLSEMKSF